MVEASIRPLERSDEMTIKLWLEDFISQHLDWWSRAYHIQPQHSLEKLVQQDWQELVDSSDKADYFVAIAAQSQPLGIVSGHVRKDRYLGVKVASLSWIYVAKSSRHQGVSHTLMEAMDDWMKAQAVRGREVFVSAENQAAVNLYERFGYHVVDHRMLGAMPHKG